MDTTLKIIKAIKKINSNAQFTFGNDNLDTLQWIDTTPISKADIEAKMVEIQADYDANQYQRDRVYPSIGDQLDMLWHSIDQNSALKSQYFDFYEAIKAVKVKNPKNG